MALKHPHCSFWRTTRPVRKLGLRSIGRQTSREGGHHKRQSFLGAITATEHCWWMSFKHYSWQLCWVKDEKQGGVVTGCCANHADDQEQSCLSFPSSSWPDNNRHSHKPSTTSGLPVCELLVRGVFWGLPNHSGSRHCCWMSTRTRW